MKKYSKKLIHKNQPLVSLTLFFLISTKKNSVIDTRLDQNFMKFLWHLLNDNKIDIYEIYILNIFYIFIDVQNLNNLNFFSNF